LNELTDLERVYRYHDATKHHFDRFARSLGYLDWASQPRPFRSFDSAPVLNLFPSPDASGPGVALVRAAYDSLFAAAPLPALPITAASIGYFLRHSLGLSAWKVLRDARWSLRVNPSSGNLHPTEAYVITGAVGDGRTASFAGVWHYAVDRHALEQRCAFAPDRWRRGDGDPSDAFLMGLTSIHWRESWKYGERAFRYCQHDVGHAVGALALSAALCGWRLAILPSWPQRAVASLIGIDRDADYVEAEREEPACLLVVGRRLPLGFATVDRALLEAVHDGQWFGRASQLSEDHVRWSLIDDVARATEDRGRERWPAPASNGQSRFNGEPDIRDIDAASLTIQRRSAVAFDGSSFTDRETFLRMLGRTIPDAGPPWSSLWWSPCIHLVLFVHRVEGVAPGLYLLARATEALPRIRAACRNEFAWSKVSEQASLWLLREGDCRSLARRLSCDQDIAADGFFSLAMIADFSSSLDELGPAFYRHLFWETGIVGQVLYLEAEAAGARATGIGCFYDDPVHRLLGIEDHAFQSLYHFTVGIPVEDARLTTEPGYSWEGSP